MTWRATYVSYICLIILYVTDLTRVLSAVRNIYRRGILSVVFTLLYYKDTDIPVTSLPDRKVSDKSETAIELRKELD